MTRLAAWLELLRSAEAAAGRLKVVRAARRWLNTAAEDLRGQRLRPFADRSQWIWRQLGQDSSITLHSLELKGTNKASTRKLLLGASVDDMEASALGVMSQGELYSLALSLFLPRAAASDSPFGFLVIDDPVQSMDPAKVHGLARVLAALGKVRQVVVFTHDTRLQQAFTDQQLPVTVREVCRENGSKVKVRPVCDPIGQAVKDARALALTSDLTPEAVAHVLPGLCRTVLEYAFVESARRRLHAGGMTPQELDQMVEGARTLGEKAALALFGDSKRVAEVQAELRGRWGGEAADVFFACNRGAHEPVALSGQPKRLVQQTEVLAGKVRNP